MHADHEIVGTIDDAEGPSFVIDLAQSRTMTLHRVLSRGNNAKQCPRPLNVHTGTLDGTVVYGAQRSYQNTLKETGGCRLREGEPGFLPLTTQADEEGRFFIVAGDGRVDEHAALTSMHTVRPHSHCTVASNV